MESGTGRFAQLIVIDASTIVGAAFRQGSVPWRGLMRARERDLVAMSEAVADEIREVLGRPKFAPVLTLRRQAEIVALLFTDAHWFVPTIRVTDCRDPGDDKYLELVLAANATVLVSSDRDLLSLHPWRGVPVLRPSDYLALA
ncbi:MAG TPA: putative toxin-antitoxin system toxin component, PIN family [Acetobacteraceae bacterium]